ncbi:hypothetical protein Tco_1375979 [Tanacetum coccineum]
MVFHNEDGNPARANIKQALGYLKDGDGDGNSQHLRYQGKENGVNILKSIDEGPFQMGTIRDTIAEGTEGAQQLAKYIWDNVKMLLEGSKLTKEDQESQLYDDFEHFRQNKGETIHDYYVRFAKLINDMRNIKMTMSDSSLNLKFINNMLPEWGRFVTVVKLNRGLRDSNYDQLYAYLKQHEAHTNENKMMLDRFTQHTVDPLALMLNVSHQQYYSQSSTTLPSTYVPPHFADNTQLDSGISPTDNLIKNLTNTLALLTQSYKTYLPQTNNQLRTSSNTRNQATVQDGRVVVQNVQGRQNRDGEQCTGCRRTGWHCMKKKLLFITGGQNNVVDEDVDEQPVQDLALNVDNVFQADDCDAFDSEVDEAPMAQTMFMANLTSTDPVYDKAGLSYDLDILSEVHDHDHYQDAACEHHEEHEMHDDIQPNYVVYSHANYTSDSNMIPFDRYPAQYASVTTQNNVVDKSLTAKLATYKEQVELYERQAKFELTEREQKIDEQLRIVIADRNRKEENLKRELHSVKLQLTSTINHNKSMVEEVTSLKKDFKQKENKYLKEFLDMKDLKEKVEDKLYKQDQFLQTIHMLCKPKPYYDEQNNKAIGYKNPLCLNRVKQDTLEIAEITRKKMNDKMKDPECVKTKFKIAPHDYSKENYLATFTPQKQLTPEQIFWSKDLIKMKAEALKEQTTASRPINVLMKFNKTCKKRITPTVVTEEERDFEQTKECYLTERDLGSRVDQNVVNRKHDEIEQKNLLIANDNLIADCLSKEVFYIATNSELTVSRFTEMHDAHTVVQARCLELEAELSKLLDKLKYQNLKESFGNNTSPPARDAPDFDSVFVIEKMKASIQGKDNAIKKLRMQISQLKETHSEADCILDFRDFDFQLTQLSDKVTVLQEQNERFRTENAKIKQHYKELYDSIKIMRAKHIKQTTTLYAIDVELIPPRNWNNREVHLDYLKHLKESVETLREIIEEAKELLEYVIGTSPKDFNQQDKNHAATPLTRKKQVTLEDQCETSNSNTHKHVEQLNIQKTNVLVPPSIGVNSCTDASGSQPRSNTKKNRILPAKSVNKKKVEEHPRTNKSSLKTTNHVDSSIRILALFATHVVQIVLWYLDLGYLKYMTRDRSRLRNFVKKFTGTVRFENDHFGAIIGYGDYVIGDSVISRVYYVERLGHNLFSVRQFCDSDLEVAFRKHSCYVRDTYGVELIKGSRGSNLRNIIYAQHVN